MRDFVKIGIAEWHDVYEFRVDAICRRGWGMTAANSLAKIAVQENATVPRNVVFFGVDPNEFGTVIAYCNSLDREATDARVAESGGKLVELRGAL